MKNYTSPDYVIGSEIFIMILFLVVILKFVINNTMLITYKIDGSIVIKYRIIFSSFHILNNLHRMRYFLRTIFLTVIRIKIFFSRFFFTFNNINIKFKNNKLTEKTYSTKEILLINKQLKMINKKEFAQYAFNKNFKFSKLIRFYLLQKLSNHDKKLLKVFLLIKRVII